MKYIITIIQPSRLEPLQEALSGFGITGMTVSEVQGYGRQKGKTEMYRGTEYTINFLPKVKVECAVDEKLADKVIDTIRETCTSGRIGDGKIFSLDLGEAMRIRTGETGEDAI